MFYPLGGGNFKTALTFLYFLSQGCLVGCRMVCLRVCSLPCSDFGYFRAENSSECVEQEELKGRPLEFCLNGTTEQLQTSGLGSMFFSF